MDDPNKADVADISSLPAASDRPVPADEDAGIADHLRQFITSHDRQEQMDR